MARCLMITSGKGGVGKTTLCANLGLALARLGKKVCLLDMDLGLKNLDIALGLENRLIYDGKDVIEKRCTLEEALVQDKRVDSLWLLTMSKTINLDKIEIQKLSPIIEKLKEHFDFILFDSPAGIEKGFECCVAFCDEAICVVQLDITSLMDSDRVIGLLLRNQVKNIQIVLNRVNPDFIQKKIQCTLKEALDYLSLPALGIVYEDSSILMSNNLGKEKLSEHSKSCFKAIAKRINHENVPFTKPNKRTLFQKMMG